MVSSVCDKLNLDQVYPSLANARTAFGPASILPSTVFVRCIPKNGKSGSAIG